MDADHELKSRSSHAATEARATSPRNSHARRLQQCPCPQPLPSIAHLWGEVLVLGERSSPLSTMPRCCRVRPPRGAATPGARLNAGWVGSGGPACGKQQAHEWGVADGGRRQAERRSGSAAVRCLIARPGGTHCFGPVNATIRGELSNPWVALGLLPTRDGSRGRLGELAALRARAQVDTAGGNAELWPPSTLMPPSRAFPPLASAHRIADQGSGSSTEPVINRKW